MSLAINNNITALNAWRRLKETDMKMSRTMERLSSGLKINRAADDPAGLVISEKMRAQLVGLEAASKNVEKAINMVATAEASLDKVHQLLDKMRALAIDSANLGINDDASLQANQDELDEAIDSISRIARFTQFGTKKLLNGALDSTYSSYTTHQAGMNDGILAEGSTAVFQVGANQSQQINLDVRSMMSQDIGLVSAGATGLTYTDAQGLDVNGTYFAYNYDDTTFNIREINLESLRSSLSATATRLAVTTSFEKGVFAFTAGTTLGDGVTVADKSAAIAQAIGIIDLAIDQVSAVRGKLGAMQANNLEVQADALRISFENLQAAESTIRDTDMTREMAEFTKFQIMLQAGTAMLAQANQQPANILQLLA